MEFKRIGLDFSELESSVTALKFEIATARCEGCRLLKIDMLGDTADLDIRKLFGSLARTLRAMKQKGMIQLFAFPDSFERHSTEAVFLLNKFPENVVIEDSDEKLYVYIML